MKTQISLTLRFRLEAETSKYVKIKSHKRVINGKVVKIRNATSDFPRKSAVQKKNKGYPEQRRIPLVALITL